MAVAFGQDHAAFSSGGCPSRGRHRILTRVGPTRGQTAEKREASRLEIRRADDRWLDEHARRLGDALGRDGRILELGCSAGRDTQVLVNFGPVVASDLSEDALRRCAQVAPDAQILRADHGALLPFATATFRVVVASLTLHYFDWETTLMAAGELRRVLAPGGMAIVRLNSVHDTNYGARAADEIERNYYRVGDRNKRFFDRAAVTTMFGGWSIELLESRTIDRYGKPKQIWLARLYA